MAQIGPALNCNGYNPLTGKCASTSVPSYVPAQSIDAYMAGQLQNSITSPSTAIPIYEEGSIMDWVNSFRNSVQGNLDNVGGLPFAAERNETVQSVAKGTGALLSIATDLPRVGTIFIGGLFIAAGLFSLAAGSRIAQIVKP